MSPRLYLSCGYVSTPTKTKNNINNILAVVIDVPVGLMTYQGGSRGSRGSRVVYFDNSTTTPGNCHCVVILTVFDEGGSGQWSMGNRPYGFLVAFLWRSCGCLVATCLVTLVQARSSRHLLLRYVPPSFHLSIIGSLDHPCAPSDAAAPIASCFTADSGAGEGVEPLYCQ